MKLGTKMYIYFH